MNAADTTLMDALMVLADEVAARLPGAEVTFAWSVTSHRWGVFVPDQGSILGRTIQDAEAALAAVRRDGWAPVKGAFFVGGIIVRPIREPEGTHDPT